MSKEIQKSKESLQSLDQESERLGIGGFSNKNFNELPIWIVPFKAFKVLPKVWNFVGYFDPVIYKENYEFEFIIENYI